MITIVGCLLFLISLVLPFYYAHWMSPISPIQNNWSNYYSSYMTMVTHYFFNGSSSETVGLNNYWMTNYVENMFDYRTVFISMFAVQLLTLALGLISIKFNRRTLLLVPVFLSLLIAVLMTYVDEKIKIGDVISAGYQLGYYLIYPAIAMFLCAFLVNEATRKVVCARAD